MGLVYQGIPKVLATQLQSANSIKTFVETGTYLGNTSLWAANLFEKVITVEFSKSIYEETKNRLKSTKNIEPLFGDSRQLLPQIVPKLNTPTLFWLDGHWSGDNTSGNENQCPLIDELNAINKSDVAHFILIDDARYLIAPPPIPLRPEQWPTLSDVVKLLEAGTSPRYIAIIEDVVVAVPMSSKTQIIEYCQILGESKPEWEKDVFPIRSGIKMIGDGINMITKRLITKITHQISK